ncbi:SanA/YdcF family protein [Eleftheria terrae]|uniref:SanA/YdcF family protein n=1 Tax=Eleftheria terrae TaxID=1597781 RepID=UPI00263AE55B|nr:ElyC/SanA/YdcF family protein [Eleftheria terrae]WKB55479.1 YdcF family protein [Eleftheria terrae]
MGIGMARSWRRGIVRGGLVGLAAAGVMLGYAHWQVESAARGRIAATPEAAGPQPVALLLGTAPETRGRPNFFYVERLRAVVRLWQLGRVRAVLISGDNSRPDYNEPDRMKADLVAAGIPAAFITCDYAGLRTLDSVVRARQVFGLQRVLIVSQRSHVERAIYLASRVGLDAQGLAAADAPRWWQVRQQAREALARVGAVLDLVVGRQPRHLGSPVPVPLVPPSATGGQPPALPAALPATASGPA